MTKYLKLNHPHTHITHQTNTSEQLITARIFTSNVRGLVKNWDKIKAIDLSKYDIIMFNEIWQIRNFENASLPGFKIANIYQRENQRGGGVIIYIRDDYEYEKIEGLVVNGICELAAISMRNSVISVIYRPPSGNRLQFRDALADWISNNHNKNIYIAGDFNLNYLGNDKAIFDSIEAQTGVSPKINEITRVQSNTCIDNVITDIDGTHKVSQISVADHQAVLSIMKLKIKRVQLKKFNYREMKESNWTVFSNEVSKLVIRGESIDEKWTSLCTDIKKIVETSFPEKQSRSCYRFVMSQGLIKSKNKKNKLLKTLIF